MTMSSCPLLSVEQMCGLRAVAPAMKRGVLTLRRRHRCRRAAWLSEEEVEEIMSYFGAAGEEYRL